MQHSSDAHRTFSEGWVRWLNRNALGVLVVAVGLSLLSLAAFLQFGALNSNLSKLIKPSNSLTWYQDNEEYKAAFPQFQQTAVIVVRGSQYRRVQDYVRGLVEQLSQDKLGTLFAPGIDPFLERHKLYFLSEVQLDQWLQGADYNHGTLLRLMDEASLANALFTYADFISANPGQALPISLETLVQGLLTGKLDLRSHYPLEPSGDAFIEVVIINAEQELNDALPNAAIVESIQRALAAYPPPPDIDVAITGEVALAHEEMSAALSGVELAGLLSLVFLGLILHLGIRSGRILLAIAGTLAMGISLTLGFATLVVGELNTLSMIFVVLFFGLGVDFAAHFSLRAQSNLSGDLAQSSTQSLGQALTQALKDTGPALALCTLTSAASFLAFLPTAYRGFAELGIISASGIVIALLLTVSVLPAALLRWPPSPQDPDRKMLITPLLRRLRRAVDRLPNLAVAGFFVVVFLLALNLAKEVRFDYSVLAMRDADSPAMRALLDLQRDQLTTDYSVHVLAGDAAAAAELKTRLLALPTVGAVTTPGDFVPKNQLAKQARLAQQQLLVQDMEAPDFLPNTDPESLGLAIAYLEEVVAGLEGRSAQDAEQVLGAALRLAQSPTQRLTFEQQFSKQLRESLIDLKGLLTARPFALADVPEHFRSRLVAPDGRHLMSVNPVEKLNDRQATDAFIAEVAASAPNAAGRSVVEWGIGAVVVEAFQQATAIAFATIFLLLLLYFRNWVFPLLVLTPIAMTVVLTFAVCVLSGISLNMANILMVPLILGLGVDTGIHIVHRYRQAQIGAPAMDPAIRRAVLISGLTTIGTFCSLSLSPHQGAASIGLLLTVAISLLLVISLVLLPVLLNWFAPARS